jgi:hypothetical protein
MVNPGASLSASPEATLLHDGHFDSLPGSVYSGMTSSDAATKNKDISGNFIRLTVAHGIGPLGKRSVSLYQIPPRGHLHTSISELVYFLRSKKRRLVGTDVPGSD